jgi:hypothetical protein
MAFRTLFNKKNLSATIICTANATLTIAGNSSVSDIAQGDEVITGAIIKQVWSGACPSANGAYWLVQRGANTVCVLDSTSYIDFAGNSGAINIDSTATVVLTLKNASDGIIQIELQKQFATTPQSDYIRN